MIAPGEQLYAEFHLQIGYLPGKSGLRYMELLRCPGEVFLPCYRKEVAKYSKFHFYSSENIISYLGVTVNISYGKKMLRAVKAHRFTKISAISESMQTDLSSISFGA